MTTNEIFAKMFNYLSENNLVANQADMARLTGVSEVGISRILNGRVKRAKQSTLRQINVAFGNIFNPALLRGESEILLAADARQESLGGAAIVNGDTGEVPNTTTTSEYSSLINAAIAAKDETIMSLKHELVAKDETIAVLRAQLEDKSDMIKTLKEQVKNLRNQLANQRGLWSGSSPWGVADNPPSPRDNV